MTVEAIRLSPDPQAAQQARRWLSAQMTGPRRAELRDVAELLVSELVTNAIVHAASGVEVELADDGSSLTVRVRDADTGPLVMRAGGGSELDEGGRGFILVDRLADAWGTEHHGGRKTVWFRLSVAGEPHGSAPQPRAAVTIPSPRTAERRLRTLLVRRSVQRVLTFEQHLAELVARTVDAVGGHGAAVTLTAGAQPVASYGATSAPVAHRVDLVVDERRVGALVVYLDTAPDEDDEAFLQLAADRLALLAAEHGMTQAEHQREAELDYLAEATEMLSGSLSVSLTLTLVTQIVVPRLADWCGVYVVDDRARPRRLTAHHRLEDRNDDIVSVLDHNDDMRQAVRGAARGAAAQRLAGTVSVGGQRTHVIVLPLTSRGRTLGVLVLGRGQPIDAVSFMATLELGRRAALAVDNARLHEEQVAAAEALQSSLLPSALPQIEGVELAARYHSASPGLSVGGDFYDAFRLDDGSFVIAVGDVCGKGAEAAAVTGMTRDTLRLLLQDGRDFSTTLRRLNRTLIENAPHARFCTLALARIERTGTHMLARICLAGHPEPVVLRADGTTELVGLGGDLLGVLPDDMLGLSEVEVPLEPGDALVLYTDGITERRDGRRMFGQYGLQQTLRAAAGADADRLVHQIERAAQSFVDTELRDDLAVLAVRRLPDPAAVAVDTTG